MGGQYDGPDAVTIVAGDATTTALPSLPPPPQAPKPQSGGNAAAAASAQAALGIVLQVCGILFIVALLAFLAYIW
jgi:hypothetical protein